MTRKDIKDKAYMRIAYAMASMGTCKRRQVGCVMVDHKYRVVASGYNGTPAGAINCTEQPCIGAGYPSGTGLEFCEALHAEQNALIQLKQPEGVERIYCTTAPCMHCVKMLANTSAKEIIFDVTYPHAEASKQYWEALGRKWIQYMEPEPSDEEINHLYQQDKPNG